MFSRTKARGLAGWGALVLAACGSGSTRAVDDGGPLIDASGSETVADAGSGRCGAGLPLPGETFFPEGIALGPEGEIVVGSFATGAVVRFAPGSREAEVLVAAGGDVRQAMGLRYDAALDAYWVCSVDASGAAGASLVGVRRGDGSTLARHAMPVGTFCNDVALDAAGDVFVTDSGSHRILRLASGDKSSDVELAVWSAEEAYGAGAQPGDFTLNGIIVRENDVVVARTSTGQLWRVPIEADGSAGPAVAITVPDSALLYTDGLVEEASGHLLAIRNFAGSVERVTIEGDTATVMNVADGLDIPATGVLHEGALWLTLTQFDSLFMPDAAGPPQAPFCVGRVAL